MTAFIKTSLLAHDNYFSFQSCNFFHTLVIEEANFSYFPFPNNGGNTRIVLKFMCFIYISCVFSWGDLWGNVK